MNRLSHLDVFYDFEAGTVKIACTWRDTCESWLEASLGDHRAVGAAMVTMLAHEFNCDPKPKG